MQGNQQPTKGLEKLSHAMRLGKKRQQIWTTADALGRIHLI